MLAPHPERMSVDEFLAWVEEQENRHELVDGRPVRMMAGAKQSHNVVVGNLSSALRPASKARGCRTTSSDTAVVTGTGRVRYPDVVVDCGKADPDARAASRPTIVVEVLSRRTSQIDLTDKLDEYRDVASMEVILIVDPDIVSIKAYRRATGGTWAPERYTALDETIDLPALGLSVPLREIYDTLDPRPQPRIEIVRHASPAD